MPAPLNAFCGFHLDKTGHRRRDGAWQADAILQPEARIALFWRMQPLVLAESGASPAAAAGWLGPHALTLAPKGACLFLGLDVAGAPHFALALPDSADPDELPIAGLGAFQDMRAAAMILPAADASALGCAKALFEWHAAHGFCARCGGPTQIADGGWKRACPACGAEHFPRVDPVVIMLAVTPERCLLGRQKRFPPGMYSALAGFVETGESLEEACRREIFEEVGLVAGAVRYESSQPWPFPSQMMIGLIAEVEDGPLTLDPEEIDDAIWLTRDQARAALSGGTLIEGKRVWAPPPVAIAHALLRDWAG